MKSTRAEKIIPAYHFRARSSGDGIVQDYVNDILRTIEEDMKNSIENESTSSQTEISTFFDVPGMNNIRAQRRVYYHMLRALKGAGYSASLELINTSPDNQVAFVHVTWFTHEDVDYEQYMDKYVAAHIVNFGSKSDKNDASNANGRPRRRRRAGATKTSSKN